MKRRIYDEDLSFIAKLIRDKRKELEMTQVELAMKAGVHRTSITKLETGIFKTLRHDNLSRVFRVLGVKIGFM